MDIILSKPAIKAISKMDTITKKRIKNAIEKITCCYTHHDRDVNAARNMLNEGLI